MSFKRYIPILISLVILTACSDDPTDPPTPNPVDVDPATRYVERGSYAAGYQVLQSGDLPIKAWYPAMGDPTATLDYAVVLKLPGFPPDPMTIYGDAIENAPLATGTFPVVILSHGFSLNPEWYHDLAEHLASQGFVVLAPEHSESDWFTDVVPSSATRPADVSATLDYAPTSPLANIIDMARVAVIGHSYGGYTALAAGGARIEPSGLEARCLGVTDEFNAAYFCDTFLGAQDVLAASMGLNEIPMGPWPTTADDRVDAIVAMAGDAYLFGEQGLAFVEVPALLIGGTGDTGTPWGWGAKLAFDHISSDYSILVGLESAEHFVSTASCDDMPFMGGFPEDIQTYFCNDPAWEKQAALNITHHLTTAFLKKTLLNDQGAAEALATDLYEDSSGLTMTINQ